jgi:hypothetical protein
MLLLPRIHCFEAHSDRLRQLQTYKDPKSHIPKRGSCASSCPGRDGGFEVHEVGTSTGGNFV